MKRCEPCRRTLSSRARVAVGVRSAASTSLRRDPGPSSPTRSGDVVTNSSSTASASRNPPNVCGPASQRIRRWPLARSARRTTSGAMRRPGPSATTVDAEGTRPSRCSAPASLVRTSAPDPSSGCPTSMSPLPVRMATSGCGRRSQALSELCVFRGCGRKDPVWPPGPSWACAKHSGADEHGVRERAQQTHHEPIRVAVPGDELVRARHRRNRNGPVDGRDEVGVHALLGEPQIAVVESRELRRQRRVQKPVLFVQELERHEGLGCGHAREGTRTGRRRQAWKRSPSTTLSTVLRSARNAMPTRSSSSDGTPATAARFASSWPVSKRSAV